MSERIQVAPCKPDQYRQVLSLALRPLPAGHRGSLVESLQRQTLGPLGSYEALVGAWEGSNLVGACWVQPQPGRTAAIWLPQAEGVPLERIATPLIDAAVKRADVAGVVMTQALLESDREPCVPDLRACGFVRLTELQYLEWTPHEQHTTEQEKSKEINETAIRFIPATEITTRRLEQVIAETYIDTLDCPELDGEREMADVIAGYRETGDHDPELWFLLQQETKNGLQDVGACLLTEHNSSHQIELIYMGVTPAGRGQGIGSASVAHTKRMVAERQAERLVLAVDTRNHPARNIYRSAGMTPWASRVVYVRNKSETA